VIHFLVTQFFVPQQVHGEELAFSIKEKCYHVFVIWIYSIAEFFEYELLKTDERLYAEFKAWEMINNIKKKDVPAN